MEELDVSAGFNNISAVDFFFVMFYNVCARVAAQYESNINGQF